MATISAATGWTHTIEKVSAEELARRLAENPPIYKTTYARQGERKWWHKWGEGCCEEQHIAQIRAHNAMMFERYGDECITFFSKDERATMPDTIKPREMAGYKARMLH